MKRLGIILLGATMLLAKPLSGQNLVKPALNDDSSITYTYLGTQDKENTGFGPYVGALGYAGANPVNIYCVDLYRHTVTGARITANVQNLSDPFGLAAPMYYGGSDLQTDLKKAAWLSMQFWNPANSGDWKAIHYAIWSLTSGTLLNPSYPLHISASHWVSLAEANYMSYGNYSDWSLLTFESGFLEDTPTTTVRDAQSMLVQSTVTPEPETYLLMATGLLFLAFFGRRRLKENGYF